MKATEAWNKFMKSGNIEDYLNYRREIEGSNNILSSDQKNNIFGASDEKSIERYHNSRGGLWRK